MRINDRLLVQLIDDKPGKGAVVFIDEMYGGEHVMLIDRIPALARQIAVSQSNGPDHLAIDGSKFEINRDEYPAVSFALGYYWAKVGE